MLDFCYLCAIMEVKTGALVLRTVKYGDSKVIVDMLTARRGRVSFVCSLSKNGRGKLGKQLFQPLTMLDIVFDFRENVQLQRLADVRVAVPFVSIPFDSGKLSILLFLAEFLAYATRDEQGNELLFAYIWKSLLWLDGAQQAFANFHLVFMMHLTRFVGFYPNLDDDAGGASWFDLREGWFTRQRPLHTDCLSPVEASRVSTLMRMNYDNMRLFRMSRADRNRCLEVVLHYYRLHVPNFPELRSLDVLRTLF